MATRLPKSKAVLVGINAYPDAPLSGCVNDVTDMAHFLVDHLDFDPGDIRMLVDKRATTNAIIQRLAWLVDGAEEGDRLVFHFSGHGVQVPSRNKHGEVDGLDEAVCPYDFDWEEKMIQDDDFIDLFKMLPAGVKMLWVSDSCHSGDLSREMPVKSLLEGAQASKPRFMAPPPDIAWRFRSIEKKGLVPSAPRAQAEASLPLTFISGCKPKQTSADAWFNNRANGALTYYLLKTLEAPGGTEASLNSVLKTVRSQLKKNDYSQVPQLEGLKTSFSKSILK